MHVSRSDCIASFASTTLFDTLTYLLINTIHTLLLLFCVWIIALHLHLLLLLPFLLFMS